MIQARLRRHPKPARIPMRVRLLLFSLLTVGAVIASPSIASTTAATVPQIVSVSAPTVIAASETIAVPRVVGMDGKSATKALKAAGLKWKWSKLVLLKSNWLVTKSSPRAGARIKPGGTVKLTVKRKTAQIPASTPTTSPSAPREVTPAPPAPAPVVPVPAAPAPPPAAPAPFYQNCAAVRAAGKAPLHAGEPGYSPKLDRDGDGIACE